MFPGAPDTDDEYPGFVVMTDSSGYPRTWETSQPEARMKPLLPSDPDRPPEHAFGKIHEITVPLQWAPTPKKPNRKARRFVEATSRTWSVNGVGFVSAVNPAVMVGSVLTVRIGPVVGEVVVRTVHAGDADDTSYYGAELISDDLQSVARDLISIHLRHRPEDRAPGASPLDIDDAERSNLGDWT